MNSTNNDKSIIFEPETDARVEFPNGFALLGRLGDIVKTAGWSMSGARRFLRATDGTFAGPFEIN